MDLFVRVIDKQEGVPLDLHESRHVSCLSMLVRAYPGVEVGISLFFCDINSSLILNQYLRFNSFIYLFEF